MGPSNPNRVYRAKPISQAEQHFLLDFPLSTAKSSVKKTPKQRLTSNSKTPKNKETRPKTNSFGLATFSSPPHCRVALLAFNGGKRKPSTKKAISSSQAASSLLEVSKCRGFLPPRPFFFFFLLFFNDISNSNNIDNGIYKKEEKIKRGAGDGIEPSSQWQQCWVLRHEPQVLV
ncbi:hypothetical protein CKAN_00770700 [Cinnamomum micranthum f. kanehirae]|uniref:Uncharacterized protein n=1 Tax=Cinnamomum micranthum f. kanehirae TaxID=337451 RepID=A0A3S4NMI3_9MAGN|nr:hypothetical protein CKAN_00770700 [Cinnamomum micranthum f. kanehirae]